MELRHLETLLAIAEEGSFTAAADALNTVQSNVSDQVAPARARARRAVAGARAGAGAEPTEFGAVVLERARRVQRELEAMRADLVDAAGSRSGPRAARRGRHREPVVGARARRRPPRARARCPAARERGRVGAALRRGARGRARAGGGHRAGRRSAARGRPPPRGGRSSRSSAATSPLPARAGAARGARASCRSCSRPSATRCASSSRAVAEAQGLTLDVPVEVEGIRLIADLVAAGDYASILPGDRDPARARGRCARSRSPACHRGGSRSSTHATRSCRSPTRRCARACERLVERPRGASRAGGTAAGRKHVRVDERTGGERDGRRTGPRRRPNRTPTASYVVIGAACVRAAASSRRSTRTRSASTSSFDTVGAPLILVIAISALIGVRDRRSSVAGTWQRRRPTAPTERLGAPGRGPARVKLRAAT